MKLIISMVWPGLDLLASVDPCGHPGPLHQEPSQRFQGGLQHNQIVPSIPYYTT
jgi:hypothetical protein